VLDGFHFPLPEEGGAAEAAEAEAAAAAAHAAESEAARAAEGAEGAEGDAPEAAGGKQGGMADGEGADGEEGEDEEAAAEEDEEEAAEEEAAAAAAAAAAATEAAAAEARTPEEREAARRAALAGDVQRVLMARVLPALHGALIEKEWESVRAPVAVAIVKLLKVQQPGWGIFGGRQRGHNPCGAPGPAVPNSCEQFDCRRGPYTNNAPSSFLAASPHPRPALAAPSPHSREQLLPAEVERRELPRALQSVANLLASRAQRVRDDARAVLLEMAVELGPPYMPYICQ
jgi:hypothetical protein